MDLSGDSQGFSSVPHASRCAEMAADQETSLREARLVSRVASYIFAARRKAQRVEGVTSTVGVAVEPISFAIPEAVDAIRDALKRIADHFDPPPPDVVDSVYVSQKLGCTTTWIADLARNGGIPPSCVVPGTGDGKPWKFYRVKIEKWITEQR